MKMLLYLKSWVFKVFIAYLSAFGTRKAYIQEELYRTRRPRHVFALKTIAG